MATKKSKKKNPNSSKGSKLKEKIKLVKITKSPIKGKKLRAIFKKGEKEFHTDFGATGYSDYTKHKDKDRRGRYIKRHMKDTKTGKPWKAGYLSLYVLWNKPLLKGSINDYKKRLNAWNRTGKFDKKI